MTLTETLRIVLLLIATVSACISLWAYLRLPKHLGQTLATLQAEVDLLKDHIAALHRELDGLRAEDDEAEETTEQRDAETAYTKAIKLANQGVDPNTLATQCGISRGEADLIVALYRASHRP